MFSIRNAKAPALLTAAALAVVCAASPARAGLELTLQESGYKTYSQTGTGSLTVDKSFGNFTLAINTGTKSSSPPSIDLGSIDTSSNAGGTLVVTFSKDGFQSPIGAENWLSQFSGNFVYGSANVELQTYLDQSNTLLGTGTLLSTLTSTTTPFALADVADADITADPYALTEVLTITTTGATHVSLDGSVTDVPEPASLTLLGSAMIGFGALTRRKRKS